MIVGSIFSFFVNSGPEQSDWIRLRILSKYPDCGHHLNFSVGSFRIHDDQKTSKKNNNDLERIKKIKTKYGISNYSIMRFFIKYLLILRRTVYYLSKCEFSYVFCGIFGQFFSIFKKKQILKNKIAN